MSKNVLKTYSYKTTYKNYQMILYYLYCLQILFLTNLKLINFQVMTSYSCKQYSNYVSLHELNNRNKNISFNHLSKLSYKSN